MEDIAKSKNKRKSADSQYKTIEDAKITINKTMNAVQYKIYNKIAYEIIKEGTFASNTKMLKYKNWSYCLEKYQSVIKSLGIDNQQIYF